MRFSFESTSDDRSVMLLDRTVLSATAIFPLRSSLFPMILSRSRM
ncbi:hypothetical protein C7S14_3316 [Burkholderia cepacia]|nr:hypothetical protein C7S14_3316 [Burkholderia cepacia]